VPIMAPWPEKWITTSSVPVPDLRCFIAADCPRMIAGHIHGVCGVHFPVLVGLA
jgi:hypothetical protein